MTSATATHQRADHLRELFSLPAIPPKDLVELFRVSCARMTVAQAHGVRMGMPLWILLVSFIKQGPAKYGDEGVTDRLAAQAAMDVEGVYAMAIAGKSFIFPNPYVAEYFHASDWDDAAIAVMKSVAGEEAHSFAFLTDWMILLLAGAGRIVQPKDHRTLQRYRVSVIDDIARYLEDGGTLVSNPSLARVIVLDALLSQYGTRQPGRDEHIIAYHNHVLGTSEDAVAATSDAWTIHGAVYPGIHEELALRTPSPLHIRDLAAILTQVGIEASDPDELGLRIIAHHACATAMRAALREDPTYSSSPHPFSARLLSIPRDELLREIAIAGSEAARLLDAMLQYRLMVTAIIADEHRHVMIDLPHMKAALRRMVPAILKAQTANGAPGDDAAYFEMLLADAVDDILESIDTPAPYDPVWWHMLDVSGLDPRQHPDTNPTSSECIAAVIEGGTETETGTASIHAITMHCVDPDHDDRTEKAVQSVLPKAYAFRPCDTVLKRVASLPKTSMTIGSACDTARRLADECGVHSVHLIGEIDGRRLVVWARDGEDVIAYAEKARPSSSTTMH